jgi:hypothetical protein
MAVNAADGCVYAQSPAVLVMSVGDGAVKEAAEHIRDAQASGSPGRLDIAGGYAFASPSNALQRTRVTGLKGSSGANYGFACKYAESIIKLRPRASGSCSSSGGSAGCQCDEYPFGSTWNGAWANRATTSVRYIVGEQNKGGGDQLVRFYQAERLLDFTVDPKIIFNLGNEALSIPPRVGGDDFWVHID